MKKIGLFLSFGIALACSGCGTLQQGTRVRLQTTGFSLYRSEIMVYNNAGPEIIIVPHSRGEGFVAEYEIGKRNPWCLWLCRKKKPVEIFAIQHGQSLRLPMRINLTGRAVEQSIGLKIIESEKVIGTYAQCVHIPSEAAVTKDIIFGPQELQRLKQGYAGRPCGGYSYEYYWW